MKKLLFLTLIIQSLFTSSCSSDDDNNDCSLKVYGYDFEDGFYDVYTLFCYDSEGNVVAIEVSETTYHHYKSLLYQQGQVCWEGERQ